MDHKLQIVRFLCPALFILISLAGADAQSKSHGRAAIRKAKTVLVSDIEKDMPPILLEKWLRREVWPKPRIRWEAVDCGYVVDGMVAKGPGLPYCVELSANSFDMFVGIMLQISVIKNGIRVSDPVIRRITISREDQGIFDVGKLNALSARLGEVLAM